MKKYRSVRRVQRALVLSAVWIGSLLGVSTALAQTFENPTLLTRPETLGSKFGTSVAVQGAVTVVGRPGAGRVDVFRNNVLEQTLAPSGSSLDFGIAVAISGTTIVVGSGGSGAYVYVRTGVTWVQQALVFGYARVLAIDGDVLVLGDRGAGGESGAASVYERVGTTWGSGVPLLPTNIVQFSTFGYDVEVSGDTVYVGAGLIGGFAVKTEPSFRRHVKDAGAIYRILNLVIADYSYTF